MPEQKDLRAASVGVGARHTIRESDEVADVNAPVGDVSAPGSAVEIGPESTSPGDFRGSRHLADSDQTHELGIALGSLLAAGDVVVMTGSLGAGKTTMTRGIGEGMGVRGDITSPTFIIAREHPNLSDGPGLVHVDAYRLGGIDELDDLDLDSVLEDCATVIEWGAGMAEGLSDDLLYVVLSGVDDRTAEIYSTGRRWADVDLATALSLSDSPVG